MNIVIEVIKQLQSDPWYGDNEHIEIAKGEYKLKTFKETLKWINRKVKNKTLRNG